MAMPRRSIHNVLIAVNPPVARADIVPPSAWARILNSHGRMLLQVPDPEGSISLAPGAGTRGYSIRSLRDRWGTFVLRRPPTRAADCHWGRLLGFNP